MNGGVAGDRRKGTRGRRFKKNKLIKTECCLNFFFLFFFYELLFQSDVFLPQRDSKQTNGRSGAKTMAD